MQLAPNLFNRFVNARTRHTRLAEAFTSFVVQLNQFADPSFPCPGVAISPVRPDNSFTASYSTVKVAFRFFIQQGEDDSLRGNIVCTLLEPSLTEQEPRLGSFTFNASGTSDFEVPQGADPISMVDSAPLIVLHFLELALKKQ